MKRAILFVTLLLAPLAQATTFYIDSVTGNDSNTSTQAQSQSTPWKTVPGMNGSGVSYTPQPGDKFLFKGGSTWGAADFDWIITTGGTASAQIYYGVCLSTDSDSPCFNGTSWPSTGWTRPQFNLGGLPPAGQSVGVKLIYNTGAAAFAVGNNSYIIFDNIEISNWNTGAAPGDDQYGAAIVMGGEIQSLSAPGTIVENMFIHDWFTTANATSQWVGYSSIYGVGTLKNSEVSDAAGHYVWNGTTYNHVSKGGCEGCVNAYGNKLHDMWECTSRVFSVHDNECYNINQGTELGNAIHSHAIYDDGQGQNTFYVYNNAIHNTDAGLNINLFYGTAIFNNVLWGSLNNVGIYLETCPPGQAPCGDNAGKVGWVANNTIDMGGSAGCYNWYTPNGTGLGTLNVYNNICINGGSGIPFSVTTLHTGGPGSGSYAMGSSEASTYGFISANKYSPSGIDPNTAAQGTNLTTSCTGNLAPLCQDTSGAPWFAGAYKNRPTGSTLWDAGAFQGQGSAGGPPTSTLTAPSNNATISGSSVTLTQTCSAVSPATVSSMQFFVDGLSFGAAGTSSPYSVTLDTTKMANMNHAIYAICTDSNSQTNQSATITVTVSNSIPGCTISNPVAIQSVGFTSQSAPFSFSFTLTPNSAAATNDSVWNMSSGAATGFASASVSLLTGTASFQSWNGTSGYQNANTLLPISGTTYNVTGSVLSGFTTFNISVNGTAIASAYTFRTANTTLDHWNLISDAGVYDTIKVCGFQIGATTSLNFSPSNLPFGNVTVGSSSTLTVNVSSSGGATTFTGVSLNSGAPADFSIPTNTCSGSQTACAVSVKFAPSSAITENATLIFTDSATGSPQSVPISGTGVSTLAVVCTPASVNFGSVSIWGIQSQGPISCAITNGPAMNMAVSIGTATAGNTSDWSVPSASNTCQGSVQSSCSFVMQFSPKTFGNSSVPLTVSWTGGSTSVTLSGQGVNFARPAPF